MTQTLITEWTAFREHFLPPELAPEVEEELRQVFMFGADALRHLIQDVANNPKEVKSCFIDAAFQIDMIKAAKDIESVGGA